MEKETLAKLICIRQVRGYTNNKIVNLLNDADNINKLFSHLAENSLISAKDNKEAHDLLDECSKNNIAVLSFLDDAYPARLRDISSPPIILFAKGNLGLLDKKGISVVGSRESSSDALEWAYDCAKELASRDYVIISGGARGIDASAHKGALCANGNTICVLGCGLNNIYPKENISLIAKMMESSLVISEYSPWSNVNKFSLLERNRITSGLGDLLLLVTAKSSGGSLSQYKTAISQKKNVICPHPDLNLTPNEGIIGLIESDDILPIKDIKEITDGYKARKQLILESFN